MYEDSIAQPVHGDLNPAIPERQGIPGEFLEDRHRRALVDESGISPGVVAGRGYFTATKKSQLVGAPGYIQRPLPALIVPMYSPDGETVSLQTRPDKAPLYNRKRSKYLSAKPIVADVHPEMREEVRHGVGELWITEGIKKADSLVSRGLPTIGLAGVWMWNRPGVKPYELRPCFDHVALHGRTVNIVYDSDVMVKEGVHYALTALVAALEARGAVVRVVYLPDAADGSKQGIDDWFVQGGTVDELRRMPRSFEAGDYVKTRLSRDGELRTAIQAVRREWEAMPVRTTRDCTDKAVMEDFITALERGGEIRDGELTVRRARTSTALVIKVDPATVSKAWKPLEDNGYIARPGKSDHRGTLFTFPAGGVALRHQGHRKTAENGGVGGRALRHHSYRIPLSKEFLSLLAPLSVYTSAAMRGFEESQASRIPALRYPSLKVSYVNGVKIYDYIARLGKKRGEIVNHLVESRCFFDSLNPLTVGDIQDTFGGETTRSRDFLSRTLGPMAGHRERGPADHTEDEEPDPPDLLTGPPIITIGEAYHPRDRVVALTDDYLAAIETHREIGGEIEANRLQAQKIRAEREAYRNRHQTTPDSAPSEEEMDQRRARLHRERKDRAVGTFVREHKGPRINLGIYLAGNYQGADFEACFVNSVLQALGEPWNGAKAWREAVLEAAEDQRGESRPQAPAPEIGERHSMPDAEAPGSPTTDAAEARKGNVTTEIAPESREDVVLRIPTVYWPGTAEPIHAVMCECAPCLSPPPKYAKPKPYPSDSAHPDNRDRQGHQRLASAA